MIYKLFIRPFSITLFLVLFGSISANAQLSIGSSSNMQVGWTSSTKSVTRHTRIFQQGTSGENITPVSGLKRFKHYGTRFAIADPAESFDYASTLRLDDNISDLQEDTFSIFGVHNGTATRTSSPSLGWFESGNSTF
jgi:hypothetical protein